MKTNVDVSVASVPLWRVVVIEDSPEDRADIRRLLLCGSDRRYQFVEAETGAAGVRAVLDAPGGPPDCLVLDYALPDSDALEVLAAVIAKDGLTICPVVVLTGTADLQLGPAVLRAGAQDFIGKSWMTAESLTRAVENAAERWAMTRELQSRTAALQLSREQLQLAIAVAGMGVIEIDYTSHTATPDTIAAALFKLEAGVAAPRSEVHLRFHPDDRAKIERMINNCLDPTGDGCFVMEHRVVHPDGAIRWLNVKKQVVFGAVDGVRQPLTAVLAAVDITAQKVAEEQLRESEEFNRSLMDGSADCIKVLDLEGRLLLMNGPGLSAMEIDDFGPLYGQPWPKIWPADLEPEIQRAVAAAGAGKAYSFHAFCPTSKGTPRWWDVAVSAVRNPVDGQVVRLLAVSRDITARKQTEAALAESEQRYRLLFEQAAHGIFVADANGRFADINDAGCRMLGYTRQEILTRAISDVIAQEEIPKLTPALARHSKGAIITSKWRFLRKDGSFFTGEVVGAQRADGTYHGILSDITERKQQQQEIEDSRRTLDAVIERCPFGIYIVDADFRFASVNARSEAGAFANIRPVVGRRFDEAMWIIWPEQTAAELIHTFRHTLETGEPYYSKDFVRARADIENTEGYEWELHRVTMASGRPGVVCYYYDSTQIRRIEQQLKDADRRKDEFLATLAHELRNPLAPIRNGLSILRMARSPDQTKNVVGMMERQLGHMVNLVDDLLDVSRVRTGKITLRTEQVTIREAVDAAVEACRPTIEEKSHTLDVELTAEPLAMTGDKTRLVQVVVNLLTNAAKYSEPGALIRLTAKREGGEAVIRVSDTGMGIAPEVLPTLWDLFTQVRDTLDKAQGGLGIGLSLVQKLVEMHGGTVAAESAGVGHGSTFTVRLPLAATAEITAASSSEQNGAAPARPAHRRVLVVDDNMDGAKSLAMLLQISGHKTATAHSGPEALETARAFTPDVVFLDIGLPGGMDGYEVARRLRADPATAGAVLVALTGWGTDEDKQKSREAGFDHHLTKPVEAGTVAVLIAEAFAVSRPAAIPGKTMFASVSSGLGAEDSPPSKPQ